MWIHSTIDDPITGVTSGRFSLRDLFDFGQLIFVGRSVWPLPSSVLSFPVPASDKNLSFSLPINKRGYCVFLLPFFPCPSGSFFSISSCTKLSRVISSCSTSPDRLENRLSYLRRKYIHGEIVCSMDFKRGCEWLCGCKAYLFWRRIYYAFFLALSNNLLRSLQYSTFFLSPRQKSYSPSIQHGKNNSSYSGVDR